MISEKHIFQALCQSVVTGLLSAIAVFGIKMEEYVTTRIGPSRKLGEEGKE
jgi:hypothetical protein